MTRHLATPFQAPRRPLESFIGRRGVGEVDRIIPRVAIKIHATGAFFTLVLKDLVSRIARAARFEPGKG